jgi:hypothetical protein
MKARGRPRIADSMVPVSFRLAPKSYDRTAQEAARARVPLATWLRRVVEQACKPKEKV